MLILTVCLVSGSGIDDGGVLGEDGDAALAFQVVGIHHPLGHLLVLAESVRLAQQEIHQRGLAVVNVGDNGDVTEVGSRSAHDLAPRPGTKKPQPKGRGSLERVGVQIQSYQTASLLNRGTAHTAGRKPWRACCCDV